ncbi:hypothetical protein BS47DRAFT_586506 [Hydnum rufescens UP504]|uniref:Uncharacterized protein n=1 Tax=Hydnum rufescens UP504 TaxID=1448309 RepID=A0A9P6B619_9AGAM|nr:hypothetical protein BS47DRAFT_586506 [Hydnum rufescens UP504]
MYQRQYLSRSACAVPCVTSVRIWCRTRRQSEHGTRPSSAGQGVYVARCVMAHHASSSRHCDCNMYVSLIAASADRFPQDRFGNQPYGLVHHLYGLGH